MPTKILVLNSGSSSVKYRLFDRDTELVLAQGLIERIGEDKHRSVPPIRNHREALLHIIDGLRDSGVLASEHDLTGIGHRVVHGGEAFTSATLIDDAVLEKIRAAVPLAPLHNPANLLGIEVCREVWPDVPQVAVFDTAFHQTMPPAAFRYALPAPYYVQHHIRRYGFHGASLAFVTKTAAIHLGRPLSSLNLIVMHLGNGASITAVRNGQCADTSMGMTPLAGLMMGSRAGDIDAGILLYLMQAARMTVDELDTLLNRESGLKGVAGTNDMRDVVALAEAGQEDARLALDMYVYAVRKYIGAYVAVLGRIDALVFTGGIGEHSVCIRERVCADLECLGIVLDKEKNAAPLADQAEVQSSASSVKVMVVATDEELEIARQTETVITSLPPVR